MSTVLLVGATGLVGTEVLELALADPRLNRVVAPTRRPLPERPRLDNPQVSFDALPASSPWWHASGAICCLGTTMRQAGSREAFRQVDFDYVLRVAELVRAAGTKAFALNSSLGADPAARSFYLRVKGEVEAAIAGLGFPSYTIVRPGLLGGTRREWRTGERVANVLLRVLGPVVPRKYRVVPAARVARVLLDAVLTAAAGRHVISSPAI